MSEARGQTYTGLYQKLDSKDDENDVYKMTKFWEKKTRDFNQIKYIKDETDRLWWKMMRLRTDGENTKTSCSIKRVRKPWSSWTTHLITPTGDLFKEFKRLRWKNFKNYENI
jgi:hypothetical protein